jgi:large subunit ribosomal protein L24
MAKLKIKKGDTVQVITGKDKGAKGRVIQVFPEAQRVLVEGVNRIRRHTKVGTSTRGAKTGGIITQEAPVHISNVMLVDPETGRPTRVGFRQDDAGKNVRISRRTGKDV